MKKYVVTLLKVLIFLLILFGSMRVVFVFYYWDLIDAEQVPYIEVLKSFVMGVQLDISTACYLMLLPAIAMFLTTCVNKNSNYRWLRPYFYLIIAVYIIIAVAEMGFYGEWRNKLNYRALLYLKHPSKVLNTVSTSLMVVLFSTCAAFTMIFCWWYEKWIEPTDKLNDKKKTPIVVYPLVFAMVIGLLFIGVRGSINETPISTRNAYFSKYKVIDVVSMNPAYNIVENFSNVRRMDERNEFVYMESEKAAQITALTHETDCNSTVYHISKIEKPNIVIVLLRNWSADLIESLGGNPSVTPNFHIMEQEGLLFTNIYANANYSEQAQANIWGGILSIPMTTITNNPEKYNAIPSLIAPIDSIGYYSSYYYGGDLNYSNILSYLAHNNFDTIVERKDVNTYFHSGKLGYHDTDMLPWVAKQICTQPEPFFTTIYTLSSRSPYDYPKVLDKLEWTQLEPEYINSAHYVDFALKLFMDAAKNQPWYDNTIFVFVADRSHETEKNFPIESFEYRRIPLLIFGEPLQDSLRGNTFDKICSSIDIPATILAQFGIKHDQFVWSKDVFNNCYRPFACFELDNGFGWKTNEGSFIYSNMNGPTDVTLPENVKDSIIEQGKAYMQHHFEFFSK